jgi:L-2-hydroxycarboxylate dehydrogenase (NAD+)
MARVSQRELHELARSALVGQGFAAEVADEIVGEFVTAEIAGRPAHGVGKLTSLNLGRLDAVVQIETDGSVLVVDGRGGNGFLVLRAVATQLTDLANRHGVGLAAVRNFSRYGALWPYTETLARHGLVGILMNSAGPAAVAPFGAIDPVTGTNPICVSFPTGSEPQTIDFSTAELVWGEIRQAVLEERPLPDGAFLDAGGALTTDPTQVNAVRAFGGAKGWALNLAVELLAGALVGAKSGLAVQDEFDCGALFVGIRPQNDRFADSVIRLLDEVRSARPAAGSAVRAPGDRLQTVTRSDEMPLDVADATLRLLGRMAAGESLADLAGNPLLN